MATKPLKEKSREEGWERKRERERESISQVSVGN